MPGRHGGTIRPERFAGRKVPALDLKSLTLHNGRIRNCDLVVEIGAGLIAAIVRDAGAQELDLVHAADVGGAQRQSRGILALENELVEQAGAPSGEVGSAEVRPEI